MAFSLHNGISGISFRNGEWLFTWKDGSFLEVGEIKGVKCCAPVRIHGSGGGYTWPLRVDKWEVLEQEVGKVAVDEDFDADSDGPGYGRGYDDINNTKNLVFQHLEEEEEEEEEDSEGGRSPLHEQKGERKRKQSPDLEDREINNERPAKKGEDDESSSVYAPVPAHLLPKKKSMSPMRTQQVHVFEDDKLIYIAGVGKCQVIRIKGKLVGLSTGTLHVEFALSAGGYDEDQVSSGFLLWRTHLRDLSHDVNIDRIDMFDGHLLAKGQSQLLAQDPFVWRKYVMSRAVFVNGYQSSSFSGAVRIGHEQPNVTNENTQAGTQRSAKSARDSVLQYESNMFACTTEWDNRSDEDAFSSSVQLANTTTHGNTTLGSAGGSEDELVQNNNTENAQAGAAAAMANSLLTTGIVGDEEEQNSGGWLPTFSKSSVREIPKNLRVARSMALYGWLSQREQLGVIRLDEEGGSYGLVMSGECDGQLVHGSISTLADGNMTTSFHSSWSTDWAMVHLTSSRIRGKAGWLQGVRRSRPLSLDFYFDAVGQYCGARTAEPALAGVSKHLVGWSTKYLPNCSKDAIERNLGILMSRPDESSVDSKNSNAQKRNQMMVMMSSTRTMLSAPEQAPNTPVASTGSSLTPKVDGLPKFGGRSTDLSTRKQLSQSSGSVPDERGSGNNATGSTTSSSLKKVPPATPPNPALQAIVPVSLCIIDDCFTQEKNWGDWSALDATRFPPQSFEELVVRISNFGLYPGLFLAPFSVDQRCELVQKGTGNPAWLLRNESPWSTFEGLGSKSSLAKTKPKATSGTCSFFSNPFRAPPTDSVLNAGTDGGGTTTGGNIGETPEAPKLMFDRIENSLVKRSTCNGGVIMSGGFNSVPTTKKKPNPAVQIARLVAGLDATHPGVLEHMQKSLIHSTQDLGFKFLKLEHLYTGILNDFTRHHSPNNRFDPTTTRAQALYRALLQIRETVGESAYLLLGGCPLGPAVGVADGMRVTVDSSTSWLPNGNWKTKCDQTNLASVRNQIRNALARISMHGRLWVNDMDCIILRRMNSKLSDNEVQGLITAFGLVGGSFCLSEEISDIPLDRAQMLAKIIPPVTTHFVVHDLMFSSMPSVFSQTFGSLEHSGEEDAGQLNPYLVLALCNYGASPSNKNPVPVRYNIRYDDIGLRNDMAYITFEFWTQKLVRLEPGRSKEKKKFASDPIPVHASRIYAFRPSAGVEHLQRCCYIGSNLHFTMGMEVSSWIELERKLTVTFSLPRFVDDGFVWIRIPASVDKEEFDLKVHGSAFRTGLVELVSTQDLGEGYSIFKIGVQLTEQIVSNSSSEDATAEVPSDTQQVNYIGSIILDW